MPNDRIPRLTGWLMVLACVAAGLLVGACSVFKSRGVIILPSTVPGATYVGMSTCAMCHAKQHKEFRGAPHAAITVAEKEGDVSQGEGCETCHGPGSLHVEGRGDKTKILKGDYRRCMMCHKDKETKFHLRYHHPVAEGKVSCTDCHDPHKGTRPVVRVEEANRKCFECHPDKQGPFAFPHDAVTQDGCTACHDPHGSTIDKLLISDVANLCLRCHFDTTRHPAIASFAHGSGAYLMRGCPNCHRAVHGSNFSEHLRFP